jgi:murein DD-endopeptidase MepM/ murein hydrolase activator NlpD
VLGIFCFSLVAMLEPRAPLPNREDAPLLPLFFAPPVERVETHVLERGQTLSQVLSHAAFPGAELHTLLSTLSGHGNPDRLTAGSEVTVRRWAETGAPRAVEIRMNADTTVRLERSDIGWNGSLAVTPTRHDTVFIAGSIEAGRNLYSALVEDDELDLPPAERIQLVSDLAEIYAYKLDFAHEIQPGDTYRLVYEREARPDGSTRRRRILAAEVQNQGKMFTAVHFASRTDTQGYYDNEGRTLRQGFRRYPVDFVRITSTFAWKRYHPVLGFWRAHLGTDFGAAQGTPVRATGDGTVLQAGRSGGYGNVVELRHNGGYTTRYAHLSRFARGVGHGRRVVQGEIIGYVGMTGLATGPHLHYELRQNGRALDLRTAKLPPAGVLANSSRVEFQRVLYERTRLLTHADLAVKKLARDARDPDSKLERGP